MRIIQSKWNSSFCLKFASLRRFEIALAIFLLFQQKMGNFNNFISILPFAAALGRKTGSEKRRKFFDPDSKKLSSFWEFSALGFFLLIFVPEKYGQKYRLKKNCQRLNFWIIEQNLVGNKYEVDFLYLFDLPLFVLDFHFELVLVARRIFLVRIVAFFSFYESLEKMRAYARFKSVEFSVRFVSPFLINNY